MYKFELKVCLSVWVNDSTFVYVSKSLKLGKYQNNPKGGQVLFF